jgi:hypothetical protein
MEYEGILSLPRRVRALFASGTLAAKGAALLPKYYFDMRDGKDLYRDEEGLVLSDQRAAEMEAVQSLAGMAQDLPVLDDCPDVAIEVRTDVEPVFRAALIFEANKTRH